MIQRRMTGEGGQPAIPASPLLLKGIDFLPDPYGHLGKTLLPVLRVPQNGSDDVSHSGPSCTSRARSPCWSRSRSKAMIFRSYIRSPSLRFYWIIHGIRKIPRFLRQLSKKDEPPRTWFILFRTLFTRSYGRLSTPAAARWCCPRWHTAAPPAPAGRGSPGSPAGTLRRRR